MKRIIFVSLILLLFSGNAVADWNVTWTSVEESIINKEYIIEVQNLQDTQQSVDISSFFAETSFDISKLKDIKFYEWGLIPYTYTVDHYDEMSYLEYNSVNDTYYIREEKIFNFTETVESEKLDWEECKAQLFTETSKIKKDNYGFINIPKFASKNDGDGTYNGTKRFLLKFKTPITEMKEGYGSSGKVAALLDDIEYHPYWDTTYTHYKDVLIKGETGSGTDYQVELEIGDSAGGDFHLEGHCTNFPQDIVITNSDSSAELDFWIGDITADPIVMHVKVDDDLGSNQTVRVYYGKSGATTNSNGATTFPELFDDIEDGDVSDWTIEGTQTFEAQSSVVKNGTYSAKQTGSSDGDEEAYKSFSSVDERIFEWDGRVSATNEYGAYLIEKTGGSTVNAIFIMFHTDGNLKYLNDGYHVLLENYEVDKWYHFKILTHASSSTFDIWIDDVSKGTGLSARGDITAGLSAFSMYYSNVKYLDNLFIRKYNDPEPAFSSAGAEQSYAGSIHYNTSNPYNHTIESDGTITTNRSTTIADDINWTAAALTDDCNLVVTEYNLLNTTIANFTLYNTSLGWLKVTNLTVGVAYNLTNNTIHESHPADANGEINFTNSLIPGDYQIMIPSTTVNITCYSTSPETLYTNYTGLVSGSYIVESNYPLNYSSLAFLMGMNYTLTDDYRSHLKVPANSIASDGIYRAHHRNVTPYLSWEGDDTITEDNVWKWGGGDNDSFWISKESINATHTWVNITGVASNIFPSMFYLGRLAMYESPKTEVEINKGQGIIFKFWNLESLRARDCDYWIRMFFDTQIKSTPSDEIDIWYCNNSFDPAIDNPITCEYCQRLDTWSSDRWLDHEDYQPHSNVSYSKPLIYYASDPLTICPDDINYIYLTSETVSSKSYILNATNFDPGICNLTYAETQTMWLRDEVAGTNTPYAYTPSFFMATVRDYLEFTSHLYIANNQDVWGHSEYCIVPIGMSNIPPTHCRYNYFWWNDTTDYNMTGSYTNDFWINLTYGLDPDNGAALTHVLSLYDDNYNFIAFINDSLIGNNTDVDIYFDINDYKSLFYKYQFKIVSTDNEGSTSVAWSPIFELPADSKFYHTINVIKNFPSIISNILSSFLSYLPLFVGILISGFLIMVCVGVFSKLKQW